VYNRVTVDVDVCTSGLVQSLLFKYGYQWPQGGETVQYEDEKRLYINERSRTITYGGMEEGDLHLRNNQELIDYLNGELTPKAVEIEVGDYDVLINPGHSIKFGCTTLNKEQVETVIKAWNKER